MLHALQEAANCHGDRLALLSADRLPDVQLDFDRFGLDTSPFFDFSPRKDLGFSARSLLIVASPSKAATLKLHGVGGSMKDVAIPAGYVDFENAEERIHGYLGALLHKEGFSLKSAPRLPRKAIAAHAGLGRYGRNNTILVSGMGSFLTLNLFFSDLPADGALFEPFARAECCEGCHLCIKNCPTGALSEQSELVEIGRCLTWLNEQGGEFPAWVEPSWHNALIGCTKCQFCCPQNSQFLSEMLTIELDEAESEALLGGKASEELLKKLGMDPFYAAVFRRNLAALRGQ
ncbi:MAG: hypothetical protein LBU47_01565 [Christensenellaceae bacterium]|jgi:epoxyqueuosine reductase|nr:hypothetical protein [Christensenellaceae bacterium]